MSLRLAQAGVACKVLEDVGLPHEQIELQAQRYDLILMGQQTRFHFETQGGYDDTVRRVLKNSPRPVIAVPARLNIKPDDPGHTVLVAYDGSLQAALRITSLSNLRASGRAADNRGQRELRALEASRVAERAIDYLRLHDIKAEAHPITTHKATVPVLLEAAAEHKSVLIVMGVMVHRSCANSSWVRATRSHWRRAPCRCSFTIEL